MSIESNCQEEFLEVICGLLDGGSRSVFNLKQTIVIESLTWALGALLNICLYITAG